MPIDNKIGIADNNEDIGAGSVPLNDPLEAAPRPLERLAGVLAHRRDVMALDQPRPGPVDGVLVRGGQVVAHAQEQDRALAPEHRVAEARGLDDRHPQRGQLVHPGRRGGL